MFPRLFGLSIIKNLQLIRWCHIKPELSTIVKKIFQQKKFHDMRDCLLQYCTSESISMVIF